MKKLTIAAVIAVMGIVAVAPAQDSDMNMQGPWVKRPSSGNETTDKLWWMADHTLNAAESDTLRTMFRRMNGAWGYVLQKAIVNAVSDSASSMGTMPSTGWGYADMKNMEMNQKPMGYIEVWDALNKGLSGGEQGVLTKWFSGATVAETDVVMKLVQKGGMSWALWPMNG
jgi:hypothetical protein